MEKILNKYETLFIIDATLDEEATTGVLDKFKALIEANGTIDNVDVWGKRKLAYPINDMNDGYYVLINFTAEPAFITELERIYNISEDVIRSIVIKL